MAGSSFTSIEQLPNINAAVAFVPDSSHVFKDDVDIVPITLTDGLQYVPWGADNQMPYHVLDMIERDETLSTCQMFNAEVCYGNGLQYNTDSCKSNSNR